MRGKILFIDTETGGLNYKTDALLSIGMVKWLNGEIVDRQEIFVLPEDRLVNPDAIKINNIDLEEHAGKAIPRAEAAQTLALWIRRAWNGTGKPWDKPLLGGHNFAFDDDFLGELYPAGGFKSMVSHRKVDTLNILTPLEHAGMVPSGIGKLEKACAHFKVPFGTDVRHTSLGDIVATALLYNAILDMIRL